MSSAVWTDQPVGWPLYGTQQTENANEIYNYLINHGASSTAAYAIIGNMTWESNLNPGQWELNSNYDPSAGFGLGQWTPSTKISNVYGTGRLQMMNIQNQLDFLITNNPDQWSTRFVDQATNWSNYYSTNVPYFATFQDFLTDTTYPQDMMTKAYMACWERPNNQRAHIQERIDYANHWAGNPPGPGPGPTPVITPAILIAILAKKAQLWRLKL